MYFSFFRLDFYDRYSTFTYFSCIPKLMNFKLHLKFLICRLLQHCLVMKVAFLLLRTCLVDYNRHCNVIVVLMSYYFESVMSLNTNCNLYFLSIVKGHLVFTSWQSHSKSHLVFPANSSDLLLSLYLDWP